uniref:Sulfhydryl oxidase n=1 Tax=Malurus cyaneus samueli TaxID=2593467 RepID=A0A8C5UCP6_9PASS
MWECCGGLGGSVGLSLVAGGLCVSSPGGVLSFSPSVAVGLCGSVPGGCGAGVSPPVVWGLSGALPGAVGPRSAPPDVGVPRCLGGSGDLSPVAVGALWSLPRCCGAVGPRSCPSRCGGAAGCPRCPRPAPPRGRVRRLRALRRLRRRWAAGGRCGGGGAGGGRGGPGFPAAPLCCFSAALGAWARPGPLYTASDPLELLGAWAVEFFASWCGHCIHFAPTWRALAHDIREWRPAVIMAAIDCASEDNQQVCSDFGITGFPTMKVRLCFFRAFSKKAEDGIRITSEVKPLVSGRAEHPADAQAPAAVPPVSCSAEEVRTFFQRNKDQYLALIFEKSNSFVGREVALDMLQFENIAVRRVLSSEEELVEKFGVTTFPSGYLLFRNGSFSRLPVHIEARSFYTYYLRTLSGITRGSYKLNTTADGPSCRAALPSFKLYMADLESALHYSLRVEATRPSVLSGAQLAAFKCYVATLVKYFPGRPSVQTYLQNLDSLERHFRGYPCGLWTIFHLLTVQAAQNEAESWGEVLSTMRCYVRNFFGCQECAEHFEAMAAKSMEKVASREESVLWLWSHHNEVNARLAGGDTEDPKFPKLQWPPPDMCPLCHKEELGVHAWVVPAVVVFLKAHFSPANIYMDYAEPEPIPDEGPGARLGTESPRESRKGKKRKERKRRKARR